MCRARRFLGARTSWTTRSSSPWPPTVILRSSGPTSRPSKASRRVPPARAPRPPQRAGALPLAGRAILDHHPGRPRCTRASRPIPPRPWTTCSGRWCAADPCGTASWSSTATAARGHAWTPPAAQADAEPGRPPGPRPCLAHRRCRRLRRRRPTPSPRRRDPPPDGVPRVPWWTSRSPMTTPRTPRCCSTMPMARTTCMARSDSSRARRSTCTAVLLDTGSSASAPAYALTSGRCVASMAPTRS